MQRLPLQVQSHPCEATHDQVQRQPRIANQKAENKQYSANIARDQETFTAIIKEEVSNAIREYACDFEHELKTIKMVLEHQKKERQLIVRQEEKLRLEAIDGNTATPTDHSCHLQKGTNLSEMAVGSRVLLLQHGFSQLEARIQEVDRTSQLTRQQKVVQDLSKEVISLRQQLMLEIAHLRDGLIDVEDNIGARFDKICMADILSAVEASIDDLAQKYTTTSQLAEKTCHDVQKLQIDSEEGSRRLQSVETKLRQLQMNSQRHVEEIKITLDCRLAESEELFQNNLQRVIVPYNLNFEQIDKSVSDLKDIVKDVLKFTKALGDKLATKLSNTIDAATFQRTIENLNESFSETYILNNQKIKQLNEKEYDMYNEMNQVKDVLENLKEEYRSSNKAIRNQGRDPFEKTRFITSLGDLGVDSDYDNSELTQQQSLQPMQARPSRRRSVRTALALSE